MAQPGLAAEAQWNRVWSLVASNPQDSSSTNSSRYALLGGRDLSQLHFNFDVFSDDTQTLNIARIRIFNLAPATELELLNMRQVELQVGYDPTGNGQGSMALIFIGDITQITRGRESATDTFVELMAADGDEKYLYTVVSQTLPAGATPLDAIRSIAKQMGLPLDESNPETMDVLKNSGGIIPDERTIFGMAPGLLRMLAATVYCRWSIQQGKLTFIPLEWAAKETVDLNAQTGLIGQPQTELQGIRARCLLNPRVKVSATVRINNAALNRARGAAEENDAITTTTAPGGGNLTLGVQSYTDINAWARTSEDGIYAIREAHHFGDTRGNDWYTDFMGLVVDPATGRVQSNGGP
jgi:hypothetical protein